MERDTVTVEPAEAVQLGAVDSVFFSRYFFPKTCRQEPPQFHVDMWNLLESPANRFCGIEVFRDGAKTTLCRLFTAKRVAYGLSRTILYIGKNSAHAQRSVEWILRNINYNHLFREVFQLRQGSKWTGSEIDIYHGVDEVPIRILALGITGAVRGINIDDYRPDLIVCDDIIDEESAGTPEQREKTEDLFFGALMNSLAPASENPDAKMVNLGTPLEKDDINEQLQRDPEWASLRVGIFDESGESVWPARWSTEELTRQKQFFVHRNQLSLWLREKECKVISPETSSFRVEWLQYYDVWPEQMVTILVIDPVPPPTEAQIRKNLRDKDFEVITALGLHRTGIYLLEYRMSRGHSPDWTKSNFFGMVDRYAPRKCVISSVNYERTLQWLLEEEMKRRHRYVQIDSETDKRSKLDRIKDGLTGTTSNRMLHVKHEHTEFIEQFTQYPNVSHDDVIETVAIGCERLQTLEFQGGDHHSLESEEDIEPLGDEWRAAP